MRLSQGQILALKIENVRQEAIRRSKRNHSHIKGSNRMKTPTFVTQSGLLLHKTNFGEPSDAPVI